MGKFLGYRENKKGIEASPDQIQAIINLQPPRNKKEVQRLTGRVTALNRFIARSSERCKPFYDLLRKTKDFQWTTEHDKAFEDLKAYLSSTPLLAKVETGDPLSLYVSVT